MANTPLFFHTYNQTHHHYEHITTKRTKLATPCCISCNNSSYRNHSYNNPNNRMKLTIISKQGIKFNLTVDDWVPINKQKNLSEIGIACIDKTERQAIKNTLLLHSLKVDSTENNLLILNKPVEFKYDPKKDTLLLKYK